MDDPPLASPSDPSARLAELGAEVARLRSRLVVLGLGEGTGAVPGSDRLSTLIGLLTTCTWTTDPAGRFSKPQPGWEAYTGQTLEQAQGDGWAQVIHPDDRDRLRAAWAEAVATGRPYHAEGRIWRVGLGAWRAFVSKAAPVLGPDGAVREWVGMHTDVEEHRAAEAEARAAQRRLSAVLDNTRMAVFMMDHRQHCIYMNAAAEQLTGYRFEETQGRPLHDVVHHRHPDGRPFPIEDCPIDRAFPTNNQTEGEEVFVHKDGHFYPVAFTASPIRDERAATVGTVIEARDIRAEREAQARLRDLVNELNHRVRNTLSTVQSIVRQGLRGAGVPPEAAAAIDARLLGLSRSHDLLTRASWGPTGLRTLAGAALEPFEAVADGRLRIDGPEVPLPPHAALALGMAFHELGANAVRHGALSGEAGEAVLRWWREGNRLHLEWREIGGPPVHPPEARGFGSRLLERGFAGQIDGEASLRFEPEGVVFTAVLPLDP